jgi:translocation and assembly module TamB
MSRRARFIRNIAIGLAAFLAGVAIVTVEVVKTDWFRDFVKRKIVTAAEEGTGGHVEIGAFLLDPMHLRAVVTDFVIHGYEPPGSEPYLSVRRAQVNIRIFTSLKHVWDIAYLGLDSPQANIIVFPDGSTNVPTPKTKSTSKETPLETMVDLAVGHLELTNGLLTFNSQQQPPLNLQANNLRVQLAYNNLKRSYQGQISLAPLYVASGRNSPVNFTITLPLTLHRDRIDFQNARISSARSEILINGSLENLRNPRTSAHLNGHLALADLKNAANLPLALNARNAPAFLNLDANATVADNTIQVTGLRLTIGRSNIEASGKLKDAAGNGSLAFKVQLALGELARLAGLAGQPEGTVALNGTARLNMSDNYEVAGNLQARDLSFQQGGTRIGNINLFSAMHMNPHRLDLQGLRLAAFGAEVAANASLEDFARFQVDGNLRHLDLRTATRSLGQNLPYDGIVSGPISAKGDLKAPGTKAIEAHARISIASGQHGIPVSGRVNAAYDGETDNIDVRDSFIALPHTRLDLSGSLGSRLNIALTSGDLHDLLAAASPSGPPPIALAGGQLKFTAVVTGRLTSPDISGRLAVNRFQVETRQFDALAMDLKASSSSAAVSNGNLSRGSMQTQFSASVGLRDWKATSNGPLSVQGSIRSGDLADVMALLGEPSAGYSGALVANANATGTIGNPRGTVSVQIASGTIQNEPFDNLQLRVNLADQLVTIPAASISAGAARINLTADFRHPRDTFASGQLHAHVQSNQVDLTRLRTVQKLQPNTAGQVQIDADFTADLSRTRSGGDNQIEFLPSRVNADISARGLRFEGQNYGDFSATARTGAQTVNYNVSWDFAGSNLRVNGNTQLKPGYPTTANANIAHLPVERVLALAKQDIPAKGNLSGTAHFIGTIDNPEGGIDLDLASAVVYDEPLDRVRARITYTKKSIDVPQFEIVSGPSRLELTARYDHAPQNLQAGDVQFRVNSNRLDLTRIRRIQAIRSGMGGTLQITASGAGTVSETGQHVAFRDLNVEVSAKGIAAQGKTFGDLTLTAHTTGSRLNFALDSDLASAALHGSGTAQLNGDYPLTAKLTFDNVAWTRIQALLGQGGSAALGFETVAAGQVEVNGPLTKANDLRGLLQLTRVQLQTTPQPGAAANHAVIQNQGPITATLDNGVVRLQSLHLTGPQTDLQAAGTFALQTQAVNVTLKANSNLGMLQQFSPDVLSTGDIALSTTLRGTTARPLINGRLELHNASVNYAEIPTGITNANGVVQFNGNSAAVQNLTAEVGGGKLTLGGFVAYGDVPRFGLRANATNVRVRLQQSASVLADANIQLTGRTQASMVAGTVTINQITYAPTSDVGSILARAAPPVQNAREPSPLLDNMKLDMQVRTSPSLAVQAAMAQNLQLDANLQIRGTASQPGVLGRISITQGQLLFFSSTYTVNSGTVSFYNPIRIEPVLNLSLETQAKGVDVVLKVTGPIDNMKLSYTSDPPLQFQEIVNLLATGKTPTSDPNILVNQPSQPPQTFEQMGESAIMSKALADPVASRLQRVFGVSQLSIDPTFTAGSGLPQAQLTLQQRISSNMTFTYVTALNDPNTQIIRVEWAVNPQWSTIAGRDQNGVVSLRFLYKKEFR